MDVHCTVVVELHIFAAPCKAARCRADSRDYCNTSPLPVCSSESGDFEGGVAE